VIDVKKLLWSKVTQSYRCDEVLLHFSSLLFTSPPTTLFTLHLSQYHYFRKVQTSRREARDIAAEKAKTREAEEER
jgi:hypothetical protein